ncbi:hypothetical protein FT643_02625 [Ketobacter sp. MCCC 1A13808]|uniref:hypothetical protein n=1 Tax=Ketobacter sp. MCCC 1A13808 TaxID=2602738 RepID=UPI0012EBFEC0|nr:hypothetical protein [Ketobacter sp. MCCC 1A13808]MVF11029.1 hypothetical protein [Ketobacter sp. MCCC 1A13808]
MATESDNHESMIRYLVLEVLEGAVNLALSYEPMAQERLNDHIGRVLRVKTTTPDWMFFLAICEDGIQIFFEYEEVVDARITLPSTLLTQYVLGSSAESITDAEGVRVSGDQAFLNEVLQIALDFSIWSLVRRVLGSWLPEFEGLTGLMDALKHHDPAWIDRLEHLPQLANETLMAVKAQGQLIHQQMKEIESIKLQLAADKRTNRISTIIGFCLIVVAFLAHNGYLQVFQFDGTSLDTMILLILSMVILIPRMISGR